MTILGCSESQDTSVNNVSKINKLMVLTTVSPITSIVENIGGAHINLIGIIPEGTNSHTFEPSPSVAKIISDADLIILNGLFLEEPFLLMAKAYAKPDAVILLLGNKTINSEEWIFDFSFPEEAKKPNPHLWTDPILALKYAEIVKEQLIVLDNNNDQYFINNYNKFKKRIELLDESIKLAVSTIDPAKRKLLTYHDSFPFFAKRYGFEIIGAVKPSDFSEPSSKELAELIDQIKKEDMQVIFGSRMFPSVVMSQIAKETGAKYVDKLRDDDLPGIISEKDHSYLGLMVANLRVIVDELGGDVKFFDNIEVGNVFSEISTAVYP